MNSRFATTAAFVAVLVAVVSPVGAGASEPIVIRSVQNDTSPPLRDILIPVPAAKQGELGDINPIQPGPAFSPELGPVPETSDVQLQLEPSVPTEVTRPPFLSFLGMTNADNPGFLSPPDVQGDVGPNHYMQWVNLVWAVWDKSGTKLTGPNLGNSFWAGFGGPCEQTNSGDPLTLHDDDADRWVVSQFVASGAGAGSQCVAVSTTADPLGSYNRYRFQVEPGFLNDYPKMGVWYEEETDTPGTIGRAGLTSQSAYTYTERNFASSAGFNNYGVFNRDAMLAGSPAELVLFRNDCTQADCLEGGLPPHLDGPGVPFGTCPTFFSIVDDEFDASPWSVDGVRNHTLCVDWNTPLNSTLVENTIVAGDEIDRSDGNGFSSCVTTPGTNLDCLSIFTMYRAQVRNFGTHLSVVLNSSVDSGSNRTGVYWLEMQDSLLDGAVNWTMIQDSTYSPADSRERWMGSIAQNADGDMYLSYTVANGSMNPAIRYTSRTSADPLGTMPGGEMVCRQGAASQVGSSRWGDYAPMSVDPSDDCKFWMTHEYSDTSNINWQTRVCAVDPCAPPPPTPTLSLVSGSCGGSVTIAGSNFTPSKEVAIIRAANQNGFIKGGKLCNGAAFEVGEPFTLPPVFVFPDGSGNFQTSISVAGNRCFIEALDFTSCQTSNVVDSE